ncbi:hypothetical protein [Streptomyces sp. NPDC004528]|uniref:hypothetical protein n=1 Tax=Streptomyces sp. NPDC004528 TaxID=3154550 RepID=UPI0033AC5A94
MIRNTSDAMKDPAEAMLMLAASMGPGGTDAAIEEQERAGQAQLVASEQLPTEMHSDEARADFEALGFVFGDVTPGDPLFRAATLPQGWKRESGDHPMWSYIVDERGRRRVSIFYKAAFYDRAAHMSLNSVHGYVGECGYEGKPIVTDDTWATREAVREACLVRSKAAEESIAQWQGFGDRQGHNDTSRRYVAEHTAERDKYAALAAQFEATDEA